VRLVAPENSMALYSAAAAVPIRVSPVWVLIHAPGKEAITVEGTARRGRVFRKRNAYVVAYLDTYSVEIVREVQP